jgi:hypothetical protein
MIQGQAQTNTTALCRLMKRFRKDDMQLLTYVHEKQQNEET